MLSTYLIIFLNEVEIIILGNHAKNIHKRYDILDLVAKLLLEGLKTC